MMSKRSLKKKEEAPYREFVDSLPLLGFCIAIIIILVCLIIAGIMMQAPVTQGHELGWV
ncbi:hypothetical protein [uncultured Methanobacterium sp.]|uniref:hypothetical protein n=1 Tax=uncultured Methanobacterium sp. TaxID=176306 RepID=UPI002AA6487C|nr:hypothetical protein [uncultured Methanobacterium sp.]